MKAFVIKNKEEKYFGENRDLIWFDDHCCASIFSSKDYAESLISIRDYKDCEVVEITIVEGDLEQKIRKQVCNEIKELTQNCMVMTICGNCGERLYNNMITHYTLNEILDKIEKGGLDKDGL